MTTHHESLNPLGEAMDEGGKAELYALRSILAKRIENPSTPDRDLAPLVRQYMQIMEALEADEDKTEGTALGDLMNRFRGAS